MVNNPERRDLNRRRSLRTSSQSDNGFKFGGVADRLHHTARVSGALSVDRNEEEAPRERFVQWVVVALSAIGVVGLAIPVALSQFGG